MNKGAEKIILYPREYNKRGESSLHSVLGVTQDGELVNIKLRINEEFQNVKNPPSIHEFSRTDRKAKNPAIASPDNSPDQPEGIILFTGVFFEKEDRQKGIKSYIASWAHVLREDSDSGEPHLGIGRIKVKKDNTMVHRNIKKKLSGSVTEEERESLLSRLEDPKSFDYSLILYLPHYQIALDKECDYVSLLRDHTSLFDDYYSKGVSFGYYRIICDHDMNPIPNKSKEFLSRYSSITGDIDSPSEFLEKFTPHVTNEIQKNGGVILIPCYRLSPTANGKNYYSYPDRLSMIDTVFKNEEGYARANMLAVKAVNLGGRGILFDRAHPLDYLKLNLDLLDREGKETRLYSSNMTLSHNNSQLHSIRIGLIDHNAFLQFSQSSTSEYLPHPPDDGVSPSEKETLSESSDHPRSSRSQEEEVNAIEQTQFQTQEDQLDSNEDGDKPPPTWESKEKGKNDSMVELKSLSDTEARSSEGEVSLKTGNGEVEEVTSDNLDKTKIAVSASTVGADSTRAPMIEGIHGTSSFDNPEDDDSTADNIKEAEGEDEATSATQDEPTLPSPLNDTDSESLADNIQKDTQGKYNQDVSSESEDQLLTSDDNSALSPVSEPASAFIDKKSERDYVNREAKSDNGPTGMAAFLKRKR